MPAAFSAALPLPLPLLLACATPDPDSAGPRACNGDPALCDRPLDQVSFPGTHNSMSNADAGWIYPNQQHGLTRQLEDGVRAMMLDTWSWEGEPYLCHGPCELGAQPLAEGLAELETFLAAHEDEVLLLILEDHLSPEETVAAFEAAGLARRAWTWDGGALPTLGALVDADTRLLVTAEGGGGAAPWYQGAWDLFSDTPYDFETEADFSCALNRGEADNPLFLVNHWVAQPLPDEDDAARVNAREILEARARACAEARGRTVTFLGVDFYAVGDLFPVVQDLNAGT